MCPSYHESRDLLNSFKLVEGRTSDFLLEVIYGSQLTKE